MDTFCRFTIFLTRHESPPTTPSQISGGLMAGEPPPQIYVHNAPLLQTTCLGPGMSCPSMF
jgi:hypothetical protein